MQLKFEIYLVQLATQTINHPYSFFLFGYRCGQIWNTRCPGFRPRRRLYSSKFIDIHSAVPSRALRRWSQMHMPES